MRQLFFFFSLFLAQLYGEWFYFKKYFKPLLRTWWAVVMRSATEAHCAFSIENNLRDQ